MHFTVTYMSYYPEAFWDNVLVYYKNILTLISKTPWIINCEKYQNILAQAVFGNWG